MVWRCVVSCVVLVAGCAAGAAHAATAPRTIAFNIPVGTLSAAMVKFAVQSNVSLGLGAVDACADPAQGLTGRYTVEDGLQRILKDTGCGYRALDARAYMIEPLPQTFASAIAAAAESPTVELAELVVIAPPRTTPGDLSNWVATGGLATTVSNILDDALGSQLGGVCEGCWASRGALPALGGFPKSSPRAPGPDSVAEVVQARGHGRLCCWVSAP